MKRTIRVLIVEDSPADAELIARELHRAHFDPHWQRVETEAEFLAELKELPDIILSDNSMPNFNALRALEVLLNLCVNARDAMPNGGELTVASEEICSEACHFIRD